MTRGGSVRSGGRYGGGGRSGRGYGGGPRRRRGGGNGAYLTTGATTPGRHLVTSGREIFVVLRQPGAMFGQAVVQHLAGFRPEILEDGAGSPRLHHRRVLFQRLDRLGKRCLISIIFAVRHPSNDVVFRHHHHNHQCSSLMLGSTRRCR